MKFQSFIIYIFSIFPQKLATKYFRFYNETDKEFFNVIILIRLKFRTYIKKKIY